MNIIIHGSFFIDPTYRIYVREKMFYERDMTLYERDPVLYERAHHKRERYDAIRE